jgi:hypothetical protein
VIASYKVCITAAGRGTRVGAARGTNKALLPVGHRAVLSRILDRVSSDAEVVIALGHEGQQIRDFLGLVAGAHRFTFVDVPDYDALGSGPGASLLRCRPHLNCPFLLFACDTLVDGEVPEPVDNWIGVAAVDDSHPFLIADVRDGNVIGFFDKCSSDRLPGHMASPYSAFIGLAGIQSHEGFWEALDREMTLVAGERQVAAGFKGLLEGGLGAREFIWHDTGTDEGLQTADAHYGTSAWLAKPEESLFFEGGRVVKYFADPSRARLRAERAALLGDVLPPNVEARGHFLAYDYVPGRVMSDCVDDRVFRRFVARASETIWRPLRLDAAQAAAFADASDRFYRVKTYERVSAFLRQYPELGGPAVVNGIDLPGVMDALADVRWDDLADGVPVLFHGDPQPENILVGNDGRLIMLDWRDDFGGLTTCGDVYYDLAKVHHALIVSGEIIRSGQFNVDLDGDRVELRLLLREHLLRFLHIFEEDVHRAGWDVDRMRVVSALTYLNIAPLHHRPYDQFLFYFGRLLLHQQAAGLWPY